MASADPVNVAWEMLAGRATRDADFGKLTTYRVGGTSALMARINEIDDIDFVSAAVRASGIDVMVLGLGSNVLVSDAGFDGMVVVLGDEFSKVDIAGLTVRAGGSARLPVVARLTVSESLTGFEWAVGIPGSVGGAVRMNAGGHGSEISRVLARVHLADLATGEHCEVPAKDLELHYRHSSVTPTQAVLWAEMELERGDRVESEKRLSEIVRWRRDHHPGGANAGSVFTNPPGDSAGRLIEACGAKGMRVGSAQVSTKHANFIQVDEGGSADDVVELMTAVRRRVVSETGVTLTCETRLIGFDSRTMATAGHPEADIEGL